MTTDPAAAPAFYGPVTGWGTQPWEEGEEPYTMWTNGNQPIGGLLRLPDEAEAQGLNRQYRHKDAPTNVLSFPAELPEGVSQATFGVRGGLLRSGFQETAEAMYDEIVDLMWKHVR